jgi:Uma2 family endonuclease
MKVGRMCDREQGLQCAVLGRSPAKAPLAALPIAPTLEQWRAMSPAARERFLILATEALSDPLRTMTEGRPHKRAKSRVVDMLGLHFKTLGRVVYVAEEMAAVYPGEEVFTPDVLAVLDVEQPDDDERMAWVVADEGRGLDLAFEVLHRGDRHKDLVDNVERYARIGITEYFVYDWGKQQLHGHRLASPEARKYSRIVPQSGRYHSTVLDLDLVLQGGELRFYQGMGELIGSAELIQRLSSMVESLEAKAEQAAAKLEQALATTRASVLACMATRGLSCTSEQRDRVLACEDLESLQSWLLRALAAASAQDVFEELRDG